MRPLPLLVLILALVPCRAALALPEVERAAPREEAVLTLAGKRIAVVYGRPALRGREMFGVRIPWGEIWRTGSDEATKLTTEIELRFPGFVVPPGEYALFTVPGEQAWQLVVNRAAEQWGAFNHDPRLDLGRVTMRVDAVSPPLERLSIALHADGESAGTLWIGWERALASVHFEVVAPPPLPTPPQ